MSIDRDPPFFVVSKHQPGHRGWWAIGPESQEFAAHTGFKAFDWHGRENTFPHTDC